MTDQPDPIEWLDAASRSRSNGQWAVDLHSLPPHRWQSPSGDPWRLVHTAEGVEIRPDLVRPFLPHSMQPRITAIAVDEWITVELSSSEGRWLGRFSPDELDLGSLGRAMLSLTELPHDNLRRLFGRQG